MTTAKEKQAAKDNQSYNEQPQWNYCMRCKYYRERASKGILRRTCGLGHFSVCQTGTCCQWEKKK